MNSSEALRILIVDDEAIVCEALTAILERFGHTVKSVSDGIAGKADLMQSPYDAAFVDIRMPGLDGISLLKWAKEAQLLLPIVMMTGHGVNDTCDEALRCGAFAFLKKPFSLKELKQLTAEIQQLRQ